MRSTTAIFGIALGVLGLLLLIVNALDYLFNWNQVSAVVTAVGIGLTIAGALMVRRARTGG